MHIELLYCLFTVKSVIPMILPDMYDCGLSNFPEAHREDSYCRQLPTHEHPEPGCFSDRNSFGDQFRSCIIHCSGRITFGSKEYRECSASCPYHLEKYCKIVTTTVNPPEIKASTQESVEGALSGGVIALAVVGAILAVFVVVYVIALCLCNEKWIGLRKKCCCKLKGSATNDSSSNPPSQAQSLLGSENTNDSNLPKQEQTRISDWLRLSCCKKENEGEARIDTPRNAQNQSTTGSNNATSQKLQVLGGHNSRPVDERHPENEGEQNRLNAEGVTGELASNGNGPLCYDLRPNADTTPNGSNSVGNGTTDRPLQGTDSAEEQVTSFSILGSNSGGDGTTDRLLPGTDRAEEQVTSFSNVSNNNSSATYRTAQGVDNKDLNPLYVDVPDSQ